MGTKLILLMLIVVGGIALQNALAESGFEDFEDFEEFEDKCTRGNALAESGFQDFKDFEDFEEDGRANVSKRGVIFFRRMVWKTTRRNPRDFSGYGCYCGRGGKGTPVDKLDRCCKVHDECYNKVQKCKVCPFEKRVFILRFVRYATEKGKPLKCVPAKRYRCWGKCRYRLCKCDAAAAKCFAKSPFQKKYKNYPQKKCKKARMTNRKVPRKY